MVALYRLNMILDRMQKCVHASFDGEPTGGQFAKYQAYYHVLAKELKNSKEMVADLPKIEEKPESSSNKRNLRNRNNSMKLETAMSS